MARAGRWIGRTSQRVPSLGRGAQLGYLLPLGLLYRLCLEQGGSAGAVFLVRPQISGRRDLRISTGAHAWRWPQRSFGLSACDFPGYRQRTGSITRTMNLKSLRDLKEKIELCLRCPGDGSEHGDKKVELLGRLPICAPSQVCAPSVNGPEGRGLVQEMREKRWLLRYNAASRKVQLLYVVDGLLGYRACASCAGAMQQLESREYGGHYSIHPNL